ncbi:MAG: hypothetical protein AAF721_33100, partial [Myxococcota bacterium]
MTAHHAVAVQVDPSSHRLSVVDEIRFPTAVSGPVEFELHANLNPEAVGDGVELVSLGPVPDAE